MQKVSKGYFKKYPPLKLFKDDVEAIISIFEQNFEDVESIIDGYKLTKISDIDLIKKQVVTDLSVNGHPNYGQHKTGPQGNMSLEMTDYQARLYLSDEDDVRLRGIEHKINSIVLPRKRRTVFLSNYWIFFTLYIVALIILSLLSFFIFRLGELATYSIVFLLTILLSTIWSLLWYIMNKRYTIIYLIESKSKTSFISRKKEEIAVGLLIAVIGAVIGSFLTVIAERLLNPPTH